MGGRFRSESVVVFDRNGWSLSIGTRGRFQSERVVAFDRNQWSLPIGMGSCIWPEFTVSTDVWVGGRRPETRRSETTEVPSLRASNFRSDGVCHRLVAAQLSISDSRFNDPRLIISGLDQITHYPLSIIHCPSSIIHCPLSIIKCNLHVIRSVSLRLPSAIPPVRPQ